MSDRERYEAWRYYATTYLGILLQGGTMPSVNPNFFTCLEAVISSGQCASTCLRYSFRVAPCLACTLEKSKLFWSHPELGPPLHDGDRWRSNGRQRVGAKLQGDATSALNFKKYSGACLILYK